MPYVIAELGLRRRATGRSRKPDHDMANERARRGLRDDRARRRAPLRPGISASPTRSRHAGRRRRRPARRSRAWREGVWRNAERLRQREDRRTSAQLVAAVDRAERGRVGARRSPPPRPPGYRASARRVLRRAPVQVAPDKAGLGCVRLDRKRGQAPRRRPSPSHGPHASLPPAPRRARRPHARPRRRPRGSRLRSDRGSRDPPALALLVRRLFPNGPSRNGAFSQDGQGTSLARRRSESDASNLVAGDSQRPDRRVRRRSRRGGRFTPKIGRAVAARGRGASWPPRGMGGGPANGRSYAPAIVGRRDCARRARADRAALRRLRVGGVQPRPRRHERPGGRVRALARAHGAVTTRVSVGERRRRSRTARATTCTLDGACSRVAFTADATNLHLTKKAAGRSKWLKPLATQAPRPGRERLEPLRATRGLLRQVQVGRVAVKATREQAPSICTS